MARDSGNPGTGQVAECQGRSDRLGQERPAAHPGAGVRNEETALPDSRSRPAGVYPVPPMAVFRADGRAAIPGSGRPTETPVANLKDLVAPSCAPFGPKIANA